MFIGVVEPEEVRVVHIENTEKVKLWRNLRKLVERNRSERGHGNKRRVETDVT